MIHIKASSEFDAFKQIYVQLLHLNSRPSDEELLREDVLACEIKKDKTNNRLILDEEGNFKVNYGYSKYIKDGNHFAQEECVYWQKEFFDSGKLPEVIDYLKENKYSKRAITLIWKDEYMDLSRGASCISYAFFRVDGDKLNMNVHMRANDAYRCMLIDIDTLNAVQNYAASKLGLKVGIYTHFVDSLHFYKLAESDIYELGNNLKNIINL